MFKSEALTPWLVVDPISRFPPRYYTVETEISELNTVGSTGRSYQFAGVLKAPPVRTFTVRLPTLGYFPGTDGLPDLDCRPELNMAVLERFYLTKTMAEPFRFDHPQLGDLQVRFAEPLRVPEGLPRGGGYLGAIEVKLIEVPDSRSIAGNRKTGGLNPEKWGDLDVFDFPNHTVATDYTPEAVSIPLGGNYSVNLRPSKPELRKIRLRFQTMLWKMDSGLVDWTTYAQHNLGRLEYFYMLQRNNTAFCYHHPVYGRLKVRFASPPVLPPSLPRGCGWTDPVEVSLIEVP